MQNWSELKSFDTETVGSGPTASQVGIYVGNGSILFLNKKIASTMFSWACLAAIVWKI